MLLKTTLLGALVVLGLSTTIAAAASLAVRSPPPPTTTPDPAPGGCVGDCSPTSPGEPFVAYEPPARKLPPFDRKGKSKTEIAHYLGCGEKLVQLGTMRKDVLAAVAPPQTAKVIPICEYVSLAVAAPFELLHSMGNATGLEPTIAANNLATAALDGRGYRSEDVVGLAFAGGQKTLVLYVHKQ